MIDSGVPIRAASRTLSILRTINELGSASLSQIARHERLPLPTAFRFVQTLVHEGMIARDPSGKCYYPTALVQSLASGYDNSVVRQVAEPIMSRLTRDVGWPVFLSERVGRRFVIRATTHPETTLTFFNWKVGSSFPVLGSVTGLVWLAFQSESAVRDLIAWERAAESSQDIPDADDLLRTLEKVRMAGYALRPSPYEKNGKTASIALPICPDAHASDVLTLTYFAAAMKPDEAVQRFVGRLRETAVQIAGALAPSV